MTDLLDDSESRIIDEILNPNYLVELWEEGYHETKGGKLIPIKDMTIKHLKNTIKYFNNLDVTCLKKELVNRLNMKGGE